MSCEEPDCDGPVRSRGLCNRHYQQQWSKGRFKVQHRRVKRPTCQHLGCRRSATVRFTLPYPITRQEIACETHAVALLQAGVQGLTIEHIGAEDNG